MHQVGDENMRIHNLRAAAWSGSGEGSRWSCCTMRVMELRSRECTDMIDRGSPSISSAQIKSQPSLLCARLLAKSELQEHGYTTPHAVWLLCYTSETFAAPREGLELNGGSERRAKTSSPEDQLQRVFRLFLSYHILLNFEELSSSDDKA